MTSPCPNCGKPVRPGARFCGYCGTSLPTGAGGRAVAGSPPAVTPPPAAGETTCPHCGKPVRSGAKFCNHCGRSLAPAGQPPVPPAAGPPQPPPQAAPPLAQPPPQPGARTAPMKPAPRPQVQPKPAKPGFQATARKYWLFIALGVALCCLVVFAAGMVYRTDPFSWRATATPTQTLAPEATETPTPTPLTPTPSETFTLAPTATETLTVEASVTETVALPTETVAPTPSLTTTPTGMPSLTVPAPQVIFQDDFSQDVKLNWTLWGVPPASISANGELELTGVNPGDTGLTANTAFSFQPGMIIQFKARVQDTTAPNGVFFDWDAGELAEDMREPQDPPGKLHFEIANGNQTLLLGEGGLTCGKKLGEPSTHTYEIVIGNGSVTLRIDGVEVCPLAAELPGAKGRISFNGFGWVDEVKVGLP